MPFPKWVVDEAWRRSRCYCECRHKTHGHLIPHKKRLDWLYRGREGVGKWEAYSISGEYRDNVNDCLILCWECYEAVS